MNTLKPYFKQIINFKIQTTLVISNSTPETLLVI